MAKRDTDELTKVVAFQRQHQKNLNQQTEDMEIMEDLMNILKSKVQELSRNHSKLEAEHEKLRKMVQEAKQKYGYE